MLHLIRYMNPYNQSRGFSACLERFEFLIDANDISKKRNTVQSFKFDKLSKGIQNPISEFIKQIRHLSEKRKFSASLDESPSDKFVSGLCDGKMVNRLLSEGDSLTFSQACEICLHVEQNLRDTENLLCNENEN